MSNLKKIAKGKMIINGFRSILGNNKSLVFEIIIIIIITQIILINKSNGHKMRVEEY